MDNKEYIADGEYGKRGYLKEPFRIFNIKDKKNETFEFHYHEFHKIVFFISGDVKYIVEGKEYQLHPYDLLLVPCGYIHKPVINPDIEYERIIIWVNSEFFTNNSMLSECFETAEKNKVNSIRINEKQVINLFYQLCENDKDKFCGELMEKSLFLQLMILINRLVIDSHSQVNYKSDKTIDKIIEYINGNLFTELSIEKISEEFYISRYHLMHKFKTATGKTIHSYIQTKRLLYAMSMIKNGYSAKSACFHCGYKDYSVFLKAFRKEFGITPKELKNY
ncbi:MAG: AraC family transcriptional regulator [Acetobacter sp.]|nr:AraC family transcriptional regulator [Bacteroides sp.]MCM1341049.1 AraC family transcriptional regulator [Acetobacter sp.]MCM1432395.1 AraC family transcriptional regulator [Clostridiales bacterium]